MSTSKLKPRVTTTILVVICLHLFSLEDVFDFQELKQLLLRMQQTSGENIPDAATVSATVQADLGKSWSDGSPMYQKPHLRCKFQESRGHWIPFFWFESSLLTQHSWIFYSQNVTLIWININVHLLKSPSRWAWLKILDPLSMDTWMTNPRAIIPSPAQNERMSARSGPFEKGQKNIVFIR